MATAVSVRKRRGVARASLTRLVSRVKELEHQPRDSTTPDLADRMAKKLVELDADFRAQHHALIDLIEEEEALEREQETLDAHDDLVTELSVRIKQIISTSSPVTDSSRKVASRKLAHIEKCIKSVVSFIDKASAAVTDACLLQQYEEKVADVHHDLAKVRDELHCLDIEDTDELLEQQEQLEGQAFDCSVRLKRLLSPVSASPRTVAPPHDGNGVKLPKLDVPRFDGEILNWRSFWEQFCVSVHERTTLSNSEKLVYLQQSLKGGSAKGAIEGLSRSGDNYAEAIKCLKSCYDRPRLIHKAHVRMILDAPPLKEGTGKELRRLHDVVQQHLRALKAMGDDVPGPFITSVLELKLDQNTLFEWQKHSSESATVPHYDDLLEFVNLRAQASESLVTPSRGSATLTSKRPFSSKPVASFAASASDSISSPNCPVCRTEKHPLYACSRFKIMSHEQMMEVLKSNNLCINCLRPGHFVKACKSLHHCKVCQKAHHTLLHIDSTASSNPPTPGSSGPPIKSPLISANTAACLAQNSLLMTCKVLVEAPDGSVVNARALLDSASSASFISERLSNSLCLPRLRQSTTVSGVAGLTQSSLRALTNVTISSPQTNRKFNLTTIIVPRVTCDLPVYPVTPSLTWNHLDGLPLADPDYGRPGRIDLLLGVDIFTEVLLHGRRVGAPGSPVAFETEFGWVLAGPTSITTSKTIVTSHHTLAVTSDEVLQRFWEIEEESRPELNLSPEEQSVVKHYEETHCRTPEGRFVVPLPKKPNPPRLGESRSQAVRRFLSLERSLRSKGEFDAFNSVIQEYFDLKHAELVPDINHDKPVDQVFYLPMHAVKKDTSTTTKIRAVFDASAKSSSNVSLNDTLQVGPTIHSPLVDVLLRFRLHRVALTADISKMYRAIELADSDRDLHRFVWRSSPDEPLRDYRMTRVTFGVSASSFIANKSVQQNALDHAKDFPKAASVVEASFYVDDCLTGAESAEEAIDLHQQLVTLFNKGGFLLRKWNSSDSRVLDSIDPKLLDAQPTHPIPVPDDYTKTLGIEWNASLDHFRIAIATLNETNNMTKRALVSDIAKTFDVLGWFAPTIIKAKILLQRVWEARIGWDDRLPEAIHQEWLVWRSELALLSKHHIPRCYYPKHIDISTIELHGFSDASEDAYAGVVYIRVQDCSGAIHSSLVLAKTKVAPIKRLTIPRLELCGAKLVSQLLQHARKALNISIQNVFAWTDSTIVLNWLIGNPRRFKTFVGNRVSCILQSIPPDHWNHVCSSQNPADCASRGLFPSELTEHRLWWNGPEWLRIPSDQWPSQLVVTHAEMPIDEERDICLHTMFSPAIIPLQQISSFTRLKRVTAWVLRFINNSRQPKTNCPSSFYLSSAELTAAESYWISLTQCQAFSLEIESLRKGEPIPKSSRIFSLHPFIDETGLLRVGGRGRNSEMPFSTIHPVILPGRHPITSLLITSEHHRLMHAGQTLLAASLGRRYHIISCRRMVRSVVHNCVTCRRFSIKPRSQLQGQLPAERVTPDAVFERVGLDYAGPFLLKYGPIRRHTVVKAYVCVFVSLTVKAVHLELVSDLTTDAFIATLRRFVARRGKPSLIWSDHGTNFVGAARELRQFINFFQDQKTQGLISEFCAMQNITWKFIPERTPHFGGLWEAAVKSMKTHLKRVIGETKLTFEEFATILTQVEACLNSRPLTPLPDGDVVEPLTPGHFLIGRPLEALPDSPNSYRSISLLKRWHLCQHMVRHFWKRWSSEYIDIFRRFNKWHFPTRNLQVDDIVILQDDNLVPTKWPLGRIVKTYPGKDSIVRVVDVKTSHGVYKRPITKISLLLPKEN